MLSSSLYRLGRLAALRPWRFIAAWLLLLLLVGSLALGLGGKLSDDIKIPGTESQQGLDELATRFPEMGGASGQIVFTTTDGSQVSDHEDTIAQVMEKAADVDGVGSAPDPFDDRSPGTRSEDESAIIGSVQMDGDLGTFPESAKDDLGSIVDDVHEDGLEAHLGGQILQQTGMPFSIAEVIGVLVALVILAITFRAILPAIIPITTAIVGIGVSMAAVLALAAGVEIPSVATSLSVMLGLAVGIDYALFIVSRHRDQLRRGEEVVESIAEAIATSGSAVIFAGMTVIIALVGLFLTAIPFLTLMGLSAAFTVATAVVIALTLLPAVLGLFGERLRPRRIRRAMAANGGVLPAEETTGKRPRRPFGQRWIRLVTKVPILTVLVVIIALGAVAIPAKDLRLALPDLGTERPDTRARQTYDLITDEFGAGYNGPLLVTADIINSDDPLGTVDDLEQKLEDLPHVKEIQLATPNRGADLAVVVVIPEDGPTDPSTSELVSSIRADRDGWEDDLPVSDVTVTGQTAAGIDITDKLSSALIPFGIFVVGLSLLLLAIVFRSIWVPVKASLGYLLSIGAAAGVVAMVFEYGWGNAALNVHVVGPVISFMPIMVMGVLFGLAMDYEVFLVSRMREEYVHGASARDAIGRGFSGSAPVVIAAALIMFAVFASFLPEGSFMLQPIALALAVGVAVDAFVVRMTLVPAVLALLGDRAWGLPRWLDRLLPHMDVEGEGLAAVLEHRRWEQEHGPAALRLDEVEAPLLGGEGEIGPLTGAISPGTILVIRSADDQARRSLLALIAGRLRPRRGTLVVQGRHSPQDIGPVQSRTHWIGPEEDALRRLQEIPDRAVSGRMIVIDSLLPLARDEQTAARSAEAVEQLTARGATIVIGSDEPTPHVLEERLRGALEHPDRQLALRVDRSENTPTLEGASV